MPLFSIITVTRNNLPGLQKTAASLQTQSFKDVEWIVIDGASSDGTTPPPGALWLSEPDRGIFDAMNKGLARAQGDYILFLNAGDTLAAANTLKDIADAAAAGPDFIYGDSYENPLSLKGEGRGEGASYKKARSHTAITRGMFTHHQSMLYRRKTLGNLRYNLQYEIGADYDFTRRFLQQKTMYIVYLQAPLCNFEPGGLSQQNAARGRAEEFAIRRAFGTKPAQNYAILGKQYLAWTLRRHFPKTYWKARNLLK